MSEFHFLRPLWFFALIPALALLLLMWRRRGGASNWQAIVSPALLPHLLLDAGHSLRRLPLLLLGLGWLLAVTALAGPTWERQPQPVYRAPIDRVLVLDMSPSMGAADLKPDRLTRARFAIQELLAEAREGRTALVVFGAEPHVVTPLTDDTATIEALLPALSTDIMPAPGDRAGPALRVAADLLRRVGSPRGEVLLLSDGVSDPADTLEAIRDLRRRGVPTSVLGVGTMAGAPAPSAQGGFETAGDGGVRLARLDESGLAELARAGGGRYQRLGQGTVTALLTRSAERNPSKARADRRGLERWIENGPWLLLPLVLIAASGFRRGWLAVAVLLLIPPPQAQAFGWEDLWLRPDQQAARLLEKGDAVAAAERFEDSAWQAMARYQAADYAAAAEGFSGADADSRYNRGNALARAGRLQEALAAYDQALAEQPGNKDAQFNRELIEKLLQQQQKQQQPQQQQQQQQQQISSQDKSSPAAQNRSPSGKGQEGATGNNPREQPGESAEDRSQRADAANQAAGERQAEDKAGSSPRESDRETDTVQRNGKSGKPKERTDQPASEKPDGAERARADVAPSLDAASSKQKQAQARSDAAGDERPGALSDDLTQHPMSEQQLALEQWLRQVPDDPAGLLRRKFMLEHLMRQKGQASP